MLRVIAARGLAGKDLNGLSDPYCIIGVSASSSFFEFENIKECHRSEVCRHVISLFI